MGERTASSHETHRSIAAQSDAPHVSVMPEETLELLSIKPAGIYVDCTLGAAGHTSLILEHLPEGRLIGLDQDRTAIELARNRFGDDSRVSLVHSNYGELAEALDELGIEKVDGILLDAGLSSMQIDTAERGFSFQADGPLDMRMNQEAGVSAADYLRVITEQELIDVLKTYGDVRLARRVAKVVVQRAREHKLERTSDLVQAVCDALSFVNGVPDEVRTVFQAIRIAVNHELESLHTALVSGIERLAPGGRFVCIAFHSGEDRIVKQVFRDASRKRRELAPDGRIAAQYPPKVKLLTKSPVTPTDEECRLNPRSHSAKVRAVERLTGGDES